MVKIHQGSLDSHQQCEAWGGSHSDTAPEERLEWPSGGIQGPAPIEKDKIGIDLDDPVGLGRQQGDQIQSRAPRGEESANLHPCDYVVEGVRNREADGRGRKIPALGRRMEKDERSVPEGQGELSVHISRG